MITFTPTIENILPSVTLPIHNNFITVGHKNSGHVPGQHCQFLCDGTNDSEVINQALQANLANNNNNSFIVLLPGYYTLKSTIEIDERGIVGLDKYTTVLYVDPESIGTNPGIKIQHHNVENNEKIILLANLSITSPGINVLIQVENPPSAVYLNIKMRGLIVSSYGIICKCSYRVYIDCSDCDLSSTRKNYIFDLGWWPTGKIYHNRLFCRWSSKLIRMEDVQRIYICNNILDKEAMVPSPSSFVEIGMDSFVNEEIYIRNNGGDIFPTFELTTSGWWTVDSYKKKKLTVPGITSTDDLLISVDKPTVEKMREFNKISYITNDSNELVLICGGDVPSIPLTLKIKRL